MSKYPHWRGNLTPRTIIRSLELSEIVALEDGLFYKSGLTVTDSNGTEISVRPVSQHPGETELAGQGIYGQFVVEDLCSNPCTIEYIPRFMEESEDTDYIASQFQMTASADISSSSGNIDDLVEAAVKPDVTSVIGLGNFSNSSIMVDAINRLADTVSKYYYDIDDLPYAIEKTYLNSKGGSEEALDAMRKLTVGEINVSDIANNSLRILTSPPESELFGNYIFIAYKDVSFEYKDVTHSISRGDICVITSGRLEVLYYGTEFKYHTAVINNWISNMYNYTDGTYPSLPTPNKDIENAVYDYVDSVYGYYANSLYIRDNINSYDDMPGDRGTFICHITSNFTYNDKQLVAGNLILVANGTITDIGTTHEEVELLGVMAMETSMLNMSLESILRPLRSILDIEDIIANVSIPRVSMGEITASKDSIVVMGQELTNAGSRIRVDELLSTVESSEYTTEEEVSSMTNEIANKSPKVSNTSDIMNYISNLISTEWSGKFSILEMPTQSSSGYYYGELPIEFTGFEIYIPGLICIEFNTSTIYNVKVILDIIYLMTEDGVYILNPALSSISKTTAGNDGTFPIDVFYINGGVRFLYPGNANVLGFDGYELGFEENVIGGHPDHNLVYISSADGLVVDNPTNGSRLNVGMDATDIINWSNGTLILNSGTIVGSINGLDIFKYGYPPELHMGKYEPSMYGSQDLAIIKFAYSDICYKVILL